MSDVAELFERAVAQHQAGDWQAAEPLYRQVIELQPAHWDAVYLLGTVQLQSGRFEESIELFNRIAAQRPDVPDLHNNLGVAYQAAGRWDEAARSFEVALRLRPDYEQALFNLGALMEQRGLFSDAAKCFRCAVEVNPQDATVLGRLADALKSNGEWAKAEDCYRKLSDRDPQNVDVQINLGYVLIRQESLDEAAGIFHNILQDQPNYAAVHNNLSYVYERQGRLESAEAAARRAVEIQPDYADGFNNLGNALRSMHRWDEAIAAFRKAVALRPEFALAEFNLGTTHLQMGRFAEGWPGYERRNETLDTPPREFSEPQWDGAVIPGQTLLVHADQGFGDTIQFVRFVSIVKQRSQAQIILECQQELLSLFANLDGVDQLVSEGNPLPDFDRQISLSSLGNMLDIELDTMPADVPYLSSTHLLTPELQQLLDSAPAGEFKIGIAWQGNPQQARDLVRSCALEVFQPLWSVEGVSIFSLQTGETGRSELDKNSADARLVDVGCHFHDFADTTAVLRHLDLIISVDTAVVHLAGALGRPVWTLLAHTPDWRWLLDRSDSPWYPTMRLFRQPRWGDWPTVMRHAASELSELVQSRQK